LFSKEQTAVRGFPGWVESSDYFTPTEADYLEFEQSLGATLRAALHDNDKLKQLDTWAVKTQSSRDFARSEITKILDRLPEYRRQVFGVEINGTRTLYVNFLPGADWNEFGDSHENWRVNTIATADGGFWYWAILFDPESQFYFQLDIHGYA
jgi:hypothetical protein